jgi:allophanate hydrolase
MVNLLDLCAVAVPAGQRSDGLPFGVQLIAPAFADRPLLELAERWTGGAGEPAPTEGMMLAVAGAHLSGQPANGELVEFGGRLYSRARTGPGYRMYEVPGPFPRPGLLDDGSGPDEGLEVEVWQMPHGGVGRLLQTIAPPLALGRVRLADGSQVTGFVATGDLDGAADITRYGGWRAFLSAVQTQLGG